MGITTTPDTTDAQPSDLSDNPTRQLGGVGIVDNYQDAYLPLIYEQLRTITVLLAIIAQEEIDLDEEVDPADLEIDLDTGSGEMSELDGEV